MPCFSNWLRTCVLRSPGTEKTSWIDARDRAARISGISLLVTIILQFDLIKDAKILFSTGGLSISSGPSMTRTTVWAERTTSCCERKEQRVNCCRATIYNGLAEKTPLNGLLGVVFSCWQNCRNSAKPTDLCLERCIADVEAQPTQTLFCSRFRFSTLRCIAGNTVKVSATLRNSENRPRNGTSSSICFRKATSPIGPKTPCQGVTSSRRRLSRSFMQSSMITWGNCTGSERGATWSSTVLAAASLVRKRTSASAEISPRYSFCTRWAARSDVGDEAMAELGDSRGKAQEVGHAGCDVGWASHVCSLFSTKSRRGKVGKHPGRKSQVCLSARIVLICQMLNP